LAQRTSILVDSVLGVAKEKGISLSANQAGSMFTWFFQSGPVEDWETASKSDVKAFGAFYRGMLERGIYLPPSQFEAAFVSSEHSAEDIQSTVAAAALAFL
ncbi:MAG TPA: aspartate aminotransferase family protein, partial [Candidatus Angelobacter sp.]|nr:aspartate aminotransferase family protein [Candidatus Angelobacter sp.]